MKIQFMVDGGADIPKSLLETSNVQIVPLYLHFKNEQLRTDQIIIKEFYGKIKATKEIPRTSAPSPNDFYEAYKVVDSKVPILMLSISDGISSTYENAVSGKNRLLEEEPNRVIEVINTKTASCGVSLLLHEAMEKLHEGFSFGEIVQHIRVKVEQTTTLFILKTLDNLVLGGRIDKIKGKIAKTLHIRLLMRASDEGTIEVTEKVRGDKRAQRRFIEQIGEYTKDGKDKIISMSHGADEQRAQSFLKQIKEKFEFKDALLTEMGPIISTHGGEGAIVISFFKDN